MAHARTDLGGYAIDGHGEVAVVEAENLALDDVVPESLGGLEQQGLAVGTRAAGGVEGAEGVEGFLEARAGAAQGCGGLGGELVLEGSEGVGRGHVSRWMPWPGRAAHGDVRCSAAGRERGYTGSMREALIVIACVALAACGRDEEARVADRDALAVLESTPWLDRLPEREADVFHTYVFARGEGVFVAGNAYKGSYEVFRYFAEDDRLRLRFTEEGRSYDARFSIERAQHPVFDWKLTLEGAPRGPEVYFGFQHRHELDTAAPRAARWIRAAQ